MISYMRGDILCVGGKTDRRQFAETILHSAALDNLPVNIQNSNSEEKLRSTSAQRGQARSPRAPCPSSSWQVIMSSWQVIAISFPGGKVQLPEASSFARPGHASILEQCCSLFSLLLFLLFWWEDIIIRIADHPGEAAVGCQTQ